MSDKIRYKYAGMLSFDDVKNILVLMNDLGGSDLYISGGMPITVSIHGRKEEVTTKNVGNTEAYEVISNIYGKNSRSILGARKPINDQFEFKVERKVTKEDGTEVIKKQRCRFRLNAVSCIRNGQTTLMMTFRSIPLFIPSVKQLGIEQEIIDKCRNTTQGLILVVGATGNGKSTLLASILADQLEEKEGHRNLVTIESPIEFVFDYVNRVNSIYSQLEVGKCIDSFSLGVENSLRMDPSTILIGESRDYETIKSSVEASVTGHTVFSTVHANNASQTLQRMISRYPVELQTQAKSDIIQSLTLIIAQRLIRTIDGKRTAIREYLIFDHKVKNYILNATNAVIATEEMIQKYGKPMMRDVEDKFKQGIISKEVYLTQKSNYETGE